MKRHIGIVVMGMICVFFCGSSVYAQSEDWSVSAANWMQYWYFVDSTIYSNAREDSLDNRFILDFNLGDFYTGMWLKTLQLDRPDQSSELISQRYFGWNQGGFNLHAGNFYMVFDKGLTLNAFLDDVVNNDNNLDGVKASGLYDHFEFDAFSGRGGINQISGDREYLLRGARGAVRPIQEFRMGFSYVRFKRNGFNFGESINANITGFNSQVAVGPLELYGEYAYKRGGESGSFFPTAGDGTYLYGSLAFEKISIYSEYKNIINLVYPVAQIRFNSPPSVSHTGRTLTDLAAARGERAYQVGALISPTYDINFDFSYSEAFPRDTPQNLYLAEKYAGLRWSLSSSMVVNYSWDRIDYTLGTSEEDEIENYIDAYYYLNYSTTLSITAYSRRFLFADVEDYHENYLTLGCGLANKVQLNIGGSTSNYDLNPTGDPGKMAFAELTIRFSNHELVIFTGGERGGLICSSGICQNRPTFQGTRIVLFSRF